MLFNKVVLLFQYNLVQKHTYLTNHFGQHAYIYPPYLCLTVTKYIWGENLVNAAIVCESVFQNIRDYFIIKLEKKTIVRNLSLEMRGSNYAFAFDMQCKPLAK